MWLVNLSSRILTNLRIVWQFDEFLKRILQIIGLLLLLLAYFIHKNINKCWLVSRRFCFPSFFVHLVSLLAGLSIGGLKSRWSRHSELFPAIDFSPANIEIKFAFVCCSLPFYTMLPWYIDTQLARNYGKGRKIDAVLIYGIY